MMNLYSDGSERKKENRVSLTFKEAVKRKKGVIKNTVSVLNDDLASFSPPQGFNYLGKLFIDMGDGILKSGEDKQLRRGEFSSELITENDFLISDYELIGTGVERYLKLVDLGDSGVTYIGVYSIVEGVYKYSMDLLGEFFVDFLGNLYRMDKSGNVTFDHKVFESVLTLPDGELREIKILSDRLETDLDALNRKTDVFHNLFPVNDYTTYDWQSRTPIQHLWRSIITSNEMWGNLSDSKFLNTDFSKYINPNQIKEAGSAEVNIIKGNFMRKSYIAVRLYDQVRYNPNGIQYSELMASDYKERVRIFSDTKGIAMYQDFGDNDWIEVPDDFYYNDWVDNFASYVTDKSFAGTALEPYYKRSLQMSEAYRKHGVDAYITPVKCFYAYLKNPVIDILETNTGIMDIAAEVIEAPYILEFSSLAGYIDLEGDTPEKILGLSKDQLNRLTEFSLVGIRGIMMFKAFFIDSGLDEKFVDVSSYDDPENNKVIEAIANYYYTFGTHGIVEYLEMLKKANDKFLIGSTNSIGNAFSLFVKKNPEVVIDEQDNFGKKFTRYANHILDTMDEYRREYFVFRGYDDFLEVYSQAMKK